ncbi:MAG TPA: hypothetical protein PK752_06000 [Accumulibacter sp.]|uniref:hypothetical protein n=1 Tax=Accumulibacter sp. TaxID=2053492 RepID=UPI002C3360FC|nr:hypothetical protein [Accumulibacter sp.]HRD87802.1 hypothetical protein [Accumulibacter sp.]
MIKVEVRGLGVALDALAGMERQIPFATALACNLLARDVKDAVRQDMATQFDRPKPVTLNSLRTEAATKARPFAVVKVKDEPLGKHINGGMAEIIGHQFAGGQRVAKLSERALRRDGYLKEGEFIAPGPDARLDQYGNISSGQIQQIMAALRLFLDPYQNQTSSKRSKRNAAKAGRIFWSDGGKGRPRRGCWASDARGNLKLLLVAIPRATYRRRIVMDVTAGKVAAAKWEQRFAEAWARAVATDRKKG